jgi:hypothetical protein
MSNDICLHPLPLEEDHLPFRKVCSRALALVVVRSLRKAQAYSQRHHSLFIYIYIHIHCPEIVYTYSLYIFIVPRSSVTLVNFSGVVLSHLRLIVPTQRAILVPKVRYFSTSCVASTNARTQIEELGPSCILSLAVKQRRINKFEGEGVKKKGRKKILLTSTHIQLFLASFERNMHLVCMSKRTNARLCAFIHVILPSLSLAALSRPTQTEKKYYK